jgi:hypothetical protein
MPLATSTDEHFNVTSDTVISGCKINKAKWGIDDTWFTTIVLVLYTAWQNAYKAYLPEASRTKAITFAKNDARDKYEPVLGQLIKFLRDSPLTTDQDLIDLNIYVAPTPHTPLPATDEVVEFEVETDVARRLVIHFKSKGSKKKGKPHGVHGAMINWGRKEELPEGTDGPPRKAEDLPHTDIDTRSPFTIDFDEEDRGKVVYMCGRWEMVNGKYGPWGDMTYAYIP